ncbi:MAG: GNAT family N-acetyltransferase [Chloroflexota bacterium]|nr:GNAT family N-acetyltransferase [Chloroflexota bacterium]
MEIPIIQTPRLRLRSLTLSDLDPLHAILTDRDVIKYIPRKDPWPKGVVRQLIDDHTNHWAEHGFGWWALEFRGSAELIGWCGLCVLDETEEVEIKYLLKQSQWGKGLATEAAKRCINYAFTQLDLQLVIGLVHPDNVASRRVLERAGLTFSNRASYFGLDLLRYTISRKQFAGESSDQG